MNGRYLLDSNIVIAIWAEDPQLSYSFEAVDETFLSTTVVGELYIGACCSCRVTENIAKVDALLKIAAVLPLEAGSARHYAQIKSSLRLIGKPIPDNDIWIAALAKQHKLTLVSRDEHFAHVDDIKQAKW